MEVKDEINFIHFQPFPTMNASQRLRPLPRRLRSPHAPAVQVPMLAQLQLSRRNTGRACSASAPCGPLAHCAHVEPLAATRRRVSPLSHHSHRGLQSALASSGVNALQAVTRRSYTTATAHSPAYRPPVFHRHEVRRLDEKEYPLRCLTNTVLAFSFSLFFFIFYLFPQV